MTLDTVLATWSGAIMVFARIAAVVGLAPVYGETSIPLRARLGIAVAFTLIVFPLVPGVPFALPVVMSEIAVGAIFGILLRLMVLGLETAGAIAAQTTSLSQMFPAGDADPQPVFGRIMVATGLAYLAVTHFPVKLTLYLRSSYDLVAAGALLDLPAVTQIGVQQVGKVFALAFSIALPFVLMGLLYNVGIGLMNRAMPQLSVSFIGAPAVTAGAIAMLAVALAPIIIVWGAAMDAVLLAPLE